MSAADPAHPLPDWWHPLLDRVREARAEDFTRWRTPTRGGRDSAVLVLLAEAEHETGRSPDVLILQRAATLRNHAGQPAFPGGAAEPGDRSPADTALREAWEEVGLNRSTVTVLAELPKLWIAVSDFVVTPVLAWWHAPHDVHPRDPGEVARVARLPVAELVDPRNRMRVRHPSGWIGPAFQVRGMLVWGFTAGVIAALLEMGGWARPWPQDRVIDLPPASADPAPDAAADTPASAPPQAPGGPGRPGPTGGPGHPGPAGGPGRPGPQGTVVRTPGTGPGDRSGTQGEPTTTADSLTGPRPAATGPDVHVDIARRQPPVR
ncbi:MAG: CoA pyrophosphatase [Micromonosporaceae bacterium]|nr:CoA pyrophosphatase [Micromonosporaceae bacterium]